MQSNIPTGETSGTAGASGTGSSGTRAQGTNADLEAQVSRLREDVAGVADSLKALAGERADNAKRHAFALRDDAFETGERYFRQAQDAASDFEEQISERVRAEPIKSVLIAVAIGYVYARLFKN